jgi:hypothetical protein
MSSDNGTAAAALAMFGLVAMSASAGAAFLFFKEDEDTSPKSNTTTSTSPARIYNPGEAPSSNCQGTTMILKKACHNPETGDVFDGTPDKCGPGKEEYAYDSSAPGYAAATGDGTCPTELRDCNVDCPVPCSGGEWKQDPDDFCKVVTYDDSNPPQKVETRLNGTTTCGTGVVSEILDETRNNFVEARGLGSCTKTRVGACNVTCPPGVPSSSGCAYYADRQRSGNGCMKLDANGNPMGYASDGSNNVRCGERGKQEFFYLPISASTCGRLSEWEDCTGPPCPVDCVGNWRQASPSNPDGWEECVGACGTQPQKRRVYQIDVVAQHGGQACAHPDGYTDYQNCGSLQPCCEMGSWSGGTCASNGYKTQTRTATERSPGACSGQDTERSVACCYEGDDWANINGEFCSRNGKIKMRQTTAGNCPPGTDIQEQDCNYCEGDFMKNNTQWCYGGKKMRYYKFVKTKDASANNPYKNCPIEAGLVNNNCIGSCSPSPSTPTIYAQGALEPAGWSPSKPKFLADSGARGCDAAHDDECPADKWVLEAGLYKCKP